MFIFILLETIKCQQPLYANETPCELKMAVAGVHFGNTNCSIAVCKVLVLIDYLFIFI